MSPALARLRAVFSGSRGFPSAGASMLATAVLALSLAALRAPAFVQTFAASVAHEAEVAAGREPGRISEGAAGGDAAPASAQEAEAAPAIEPAAGPVRSPDKLADVAAELAERAKELDRREQELALREAAAAAVEARAREQLARLAQLNKELERLLAAIRAEDEAKLAQLVKTYEAMKAKSAAQVFDQLALDVLIPVARRIREAKLAAIMAAMDPVKAKQLTAALAQPTPLPKPP